jgi:hypothetical protein
MRNTRILAAVLVLAASIVFPAAAAELSTQRTSAGGVTVAVTPVDIAAEAKAWEFKVVLDTHSADLSDDRVKSAALVDAAGRRYSPVAWDGAGPGGHHRAGVLRFQPILPRPQSIELQLARSVESVPRVFRWSLD